MRFSILKKYLILFFTCSFFLSTLCNAQNINQLQGDIANAKSDSQRVAAYEKLIHYYKSINIDSAYYYAEQGLQRAITDKNLLGEAHMIEQLGRMDQSQGRVEIAKERIAYALKIYLELNKPNGIAAMNNSIGAIEATLGNNELALSHFLKALKIYDSIKTDLPGSMVTNMNIGCLYLQSGDTTNSAKYLSIAEAISKKTPISDFTISLYNYIGIQYAMKDNQSKALEYFLENVKISDQPQFIASHVESLLYLGNYYNDMGDTKTAMDYLKKGLAIATEQKMSESQADILLQMSILLGKSDAAQAMKYAQEALALSEQLQSKTLKMDIYRQIGAIHEQNGNYKEANVALKMQQAIKDSINKINKIKELSSLGAVYELDKSNLKLAQVSKQRNIITVVTVSIVAVLITLVIFYINTRKLNIKLIKHEAELTELNNTKNKLFSIIGHDLRWPVARIPTILEIIDDEETTAEERKYLAGSLREHTKVTVETLDKLLYWGQSLMKGLQIRPENIFSKKYVQETINLRKIAAEEKEITVIDNIPETLEVYTDPAHFDFIIRNLFGNAIKFTGVKGSITFYADTNQKEGFVVFSVKDTGVGIDKDRLQKIFEPFNSKDGTANEKGTGIGLMLCKEFAMKNGGDIWAESEPGKGSTFFYSVKKTA